MTNVSPRPFRPSRRAVFGLGATALAVSGLAACGSSSGGGSGSGGFEEQALTLPTHVEPPVPEGGIASEVEGMPMIFTSPLKEYFTSVDEAPGTGDEVTTFQVLWGAPPRPREQNEYWQALEERLNVTFTPTLTAADGYNDKFSTTIASGSVPDLSFVQDTDAIGQRALADGAFADLSEVLSGDNILKWPNLANVSTNAWQVSAKNGHIYGVPNENPFLTNFPLVRADLMRRAGHDSMGSTAEEWLQVMTDIAGLGTAHGKQIWGMSTIGGNEQAMFEWMFRAGTTWQLDDAGKVTNVLMTDAFEQVMEFEKQLWDAGVIHPDGIGGELPDLFTTGQIALTIDSFNGFFGNPIIGQVVDSTPEAEPEFFVPPAFDGGDIVIQRDDGYWGIVAISAEAAEDEARLHALLGVINYWRAPFGSQEALFIGSGTEGVNYEFGPDHEVVGLEDEQADADRAALQWLGAFNSPIFSIGATLTDYVDNFRTTMEQLVSATVPNPVAGTIAPSAATLNAKLDSLNEDYRNGFITGRRPLSELAAYREAWLSGGGQTLCDEYTAALDEAS
ncbi:extracellular solute-binding protein [Brachybacterium sp. AOP35-5H-19]|uniref:extracellular solute-binding protein n=1 Tax=Brachybacterium sp. AOP35-5H-19 TaxID=3457685 RepID=UPI004034BCCE